MKFLTKEEFLKVANANKCSNWTVTEERWLYHKIVIDIIKNIKIKDPKKILQGGTLGASLVEGTDTIDFDKKWNFDGMNPTYLHDLRKTPWPVPDKKYELVTFLRVFHHLKSVQKKCFLEAKRISKRIIIVVPTVSKGFGITIEDFVKWNKGVRPSIYMDLKTINKNDGENKLYFWDSDVNV